MNDAWNKANAALPAAQQEQMAPLPATSTPGVLAVMQADALAAEEWRFKQAGDAVAFAACKTSNAAHAAVAELFEASGQLRLDYCPRGLPYIKGLARLMDARAAFGGDQ